MVLRSVAAFMLLGGFAVPVHAQSAGEYTVPELVKEMSKAIVHVAALDAQGKPTSLGSGFIVRSDGLVVTAFHMIAGAHGAMVKTADDEIYDRIEVFDYDERRDIAMLKIRPFHTLPALTLAKTDDLTIGEPTAVIGNPEGLEQAVSAGIVSGHRQAEGYRVIQTTAPVSHGSSGSPVFNMRGDVIGIATSAVNAPGAQNLNFAIPDYTPPADVTVNCLPPVGTVMRMLPPTTSAPGIGAGPPPAVVQ